MARDKDGVYRCVRGSHGVGKVLGKDKWVHVSAIPYLSAKERDLIARAVGVIDKKSVEHVDFNQDVIIKISPRSREGGVTFCYSPDWKIATEPECGLMVGVAGLDGISATIRVTKPPKIPYIYHHKWMFVADNYAGFNVAKAKKWSELWENHPVVRALMADKSEHFRLKIGKKDYWVKNVIIPITNVRTPRL